LIDESALAVRAGTEAAARSRLRSRRVIIGMILFAMVLPLVAFEVILAAFPRERLPGALRTINTFYARRAEWNTLIAGDAYLGFKLRPDVEVRWPFEAGTVAVRTTSHGLGPIGFRDIGTRPPFEVIAIGDSFTFCDEVPAESCWVRLLANASGVSIATLGVSGYSNLAEARMLKRYGAALAPRLVLVGVFPNDLADNVNFDKWSRSGSDDLSAWLQDARGPHRAGRWLEEHSALYRLLAAALRSRERSVRWHREGPLDLVLRLDDWWVETVSAPDRHPGWPLMQAALLDMHRAAADIQAELMVLIFPTKEDTYWHIVRGSLPAAVAADGDRLSRLIIRFLDEHAIFGCHLADELRAHAQQGRQLYHRVSGHFNEEGNRVAASVIAGCLAARRLMHRQGPSGPPSDARRAG